MKKINTLIASAAEDNDGKYWFFERIYNSVGYFTKDSYQMHVVSVYSKELQRFSALDIYLIEGTLVITSQFSLDVLVYDIRKDEFEFFQCKEEELASQYTSVFWNDRIILFPVDTEYATYIFYVRKKEFKRIVWIEQEEMHEKIGHIYQEKDQVWMPVLNKNVILLFHIESCRYEIIILEKEVHLKAVCKKEDELWLSQCDRMSLLRYRRDCCEEIILKQSDIDKSRGEPFSKLFCVGQNVIVMPRFGESLFIYNINKKEIREITLPAIQGEKESTGSLLFGFFVKGSRIVFLPWRRSKIFQLDLDSYLLDEYDLYVDISELYRILPEGILPEESAKDLDELCNGREKKSLQNSDRYSVIGRDIFRKMK